MQMFERTQLMLILIFDTPDDDDVADGRACVRVRHTHTRTPVVCRAIIRREQCCSERKLTHTTLLKGLITTLDQKCPTAGHDQTNSEGQVIFHNAVSRWSCMEDTHCTCQRSSAVCQSLGGAQYAFD